MYEYHPLKFCLRRPAEKKFDLTQIQRGNKERSYFYGMPFFFSFNFYWLNLFLENFIHIHSTLCLPILFSYFSSPQPSLAHSCFSVLFCNSLILTRTIMGPWVQTVHWILVQAQYCLGPMLIIQIPWGHFVITMLFLWR